MVISFVDAACFIGTCCQGQSMMLPGDRAYHNSMRPMMRVCVPPPRRHAPFIHLHTHTPSTQPIPRGAAQHVTRGALAGEPHRLQ